MLNTKYFRVDLDRLVHLNYHIMFFLKRFGEKTGGEPVSGSSVAAGGWEGAQLDRICTIFCVFT